jgi:uncharacterized membrane protein
MITPLIVAFLGYAFLAVVAIMDKFILTKSVKRTATLTFYSTIFFLIIFVLLPWVGKLDSTLHYVISLVSGLAFGFGLWTMFISLKEGEASHISPFVGGVTAVATYVFSYFILSEDLSQKTLFGFVFLTFACFLLSFEKSRRHKGFHRGFVWAVFAGILFGLSHVTAKMIYDLYSFGVGLVWTKGSIGFVGVIAMLAPSFWQQFRAKSQSVAPESSSRGKAILITSSRLFGLVGTLLVQYAIAIGSVTVVNGLAGMQYVIMFILIYILTKIRPGLFLEYFTRKEITVEASALVLVVIGLLILS